MAAFQTIPPEELQQNPFQSIGKDWMLVTAAKNNKANTMTAGWGALGVMWGKNVAYIAIRPQRYTKEFIDHASTFSLSFFSQDKKEMLGYLGKVSGRHEDKISKSGLALVYSASTPYFAEANLVLICQKLYAQELRPDCFIAQELKHTWYADGDYHTMYVGEITKALVKD